MAALAYLGSGESWSACQPQHILSGMIRGNPDTDVYFRRWQDIEKITPYSLFLGQHISSISEKSDYLPLLIVGSREGVGLVLSAEVRGTNQVAEVKWRITQSEEITVSAQGRAYWFAAFSSHCRIQTLEVP